MRKSFYSLSGLVRTKMGKDPLDGSVYVFINARRDRIKLLHMEPGGLVLYTKILERGELHVPQRLSGPGTKAIEWRELVVMIEGMIVDERHHYRRVRRVQPLQFSFGSSSSATAEAERAISASSRSFGS